MTDPQISPDGTRIVYGRTVTDRATQQATSHLWLCDGDGGNARQLTHGGQQNAWARWSPDGTQIAFVSDRVAQSGLFVLPPDGHGEAREVTRHGGAITNIAWSPDGAYLAYNAPFDPANPEERAPDAGAAPPVRAIRRRDYKLDGRGFLGEVRQQVFVVAVAGGGRRLLTRETGDHLGPRWSPDGRGLAVRRGVRDAALRTQVALIDVPTGGVRTIGAAMGGVAYTCSPAAPRRAASPTATSTHSRTTRCAASPMICPSSPPRWPGTARPRRPSGARRTRCCRTASAPGGAASTTSRSPAVRPSRSSPGRPCTAG